jgi:hypothetical protein
MVISLKMGGEATDGLPASLGLKKWRAEIIYLFLIETGFQRLDNWIMAQNDSER